jgi:hypothetical protein
MAISKCEKTDDGQHVWDEKEDIECAYCRIRLDLYLAHLKVQIDTLTEDNEYMKDRLALFSDCMNRAQRIWKKDYPEARWYPSGDTSLSYIYDQIMQLENYIKRSAKFRAERIKRPLEIPPGLEGYLRKDSNESS